METPHEDPESTPTLGVEFSTAGLTLAQPESHYAASAMVRAARFAALAGEEELEFARLLAVPLATLDGEPRTGRDIITGPTVLYLIDAYRAKPERTAAEVGWLRERLRPSIDLVLVCPRRALDQADAIRSKNDTQIYLDTQGQFRRLVSPGGKRVTLLVEPESAIIERLSATSPIFAVHGGPDGADRHGADHTIDLSDVCH
ncbi:MAG: hypothetical protein H0V37_05045 [Chloroflexia bacterium]|nr:hypothetical protein [Chloroflexia bacterium]